MPAGAVIPACCKRHDAILEIRISTGAGVG
jgi:hypothetical protein